MFLAAKVQFGGVLQARHLRVRSKRVRSPFCCRSRGRQLFDLSDEMATKLDIEFYQDGRDALLKALAD